MTIAFGQGALNGPCYLPCSRRFLGLILVLYDQANLVTAPTSPRAQRSPYRICHSPALMSFSEHAWTDVVRFNTPNVYGRSQNCRRTKYDVHPRKTEREVLRPSTSPHRRQPPGYMCRLRSR